MSPTVAVPAGLGFRAVRGRALGGGPVRSMVVEVVMDALDVQITAMVAAHLTDDEVLHLAALRARILAGEVHEDTTEQRRAMFARYLAIKSGRYLED